MLCSDCREVGYKPLFDDDPNEIICICMIDNHYIGYPDELNQKCEVEKET